MTATPLNPPEFWMERYRNDSTPWDLGQGAPPFIDIISHRPELLPPGRMAVLGSGKGHDANLFAERGFDVTGFDYVAEAVEHAQALYGERVTFVQADIFDLPEHYAGQFDYVLEHTCFCAIHPQQRDSYVQAVLRLLKSDGKLLALFWKTDNDQGPPHTTTLSELQQRFSADFEIVLLERAVNSTASRHDQEWLAIFQKRAKSPAEATPG